MTETREMRLGRTESSFFVGVRPPLDDGERLDSPRQGIVALESSSRPDGSQIFVYPRAAFGMSAQEREPAFIEYVQGAAKRLGDVALDTDFIEIERGVMSLFEAVEKAAA
ncbi:MAG TPA: hypothetical protein VK712_02385 [Verrucomicrobiae bacterium]|jgi:hypothetical protein|nr:hypothetical protein [Verrucomicrobiae bacterium]